MKLNAGELFRAARNAQKAGLLELLPAMNGRIAPGERFFESFQRDLLEKLDLDKLDEVLHYLAPTIRYMADEERWTPEEFTSDDVFRAVRNLQRMGVFEIAKAGLRLPGSGDRFFEYYQAVLTEKIGTERLNSLLHTLGQCIKFLATDAAMVNVKSIKERRTCA